MDSQERCEWSGRPLTESGGLRRAQHTGLPGVPEIGHRRNDAPMPSVDVGETEGIVELYNIHGVLGAYRITSGGLRWDEELAKRSQRRRDRLGSRSAAWEKEQKL